MDVVPLELREAQGGPPAAIASFLSQLTQTTSSTTTTDSTTATTATTSTTPTTSTSSTSSDTSNTAQTATSTASTNVATSTSATSSTTAASQRDTTATTGATTNLSTSSESGSASRTDTSDASSATGLGTLSTSIAGASISQTTIASSSGAYGSGSASATNGVPLVPVSAAHHSGLSPGAIAAAVVVPVLFALLALLLAFLCLRRRSRDRHGRTGSGLPFLGAAREKRTGSADREVGHTGNPMATTASSMERIHTYLAGLGTSLGGSTRGDSQEYHDSHANSLDNSPIERSLEKAFDLGTIAAPNTTGQSRMPPPGTLAAPLVSRYSSAWDRNDDEAKTSVENPEHASPFNDPDSPIESPASASPPNNLMIAATDERPGTNASHRSITSTLYSDAASIHDAQAAHVSTAPAAQTSTATIVESTAPRPLSVQIRHVDTGLSPVEGPFGDPSSAVSSMHSATSSLSAPGVSRSGSVDSGVSALHPRS